MEKPSEETVPNFDFLFANDINIDSQPCKQVIVFMPMRRKHHNSDNELTVEDITTWTSLKALLNNARYMRQNV